MHGTGRNSYTVCVKLLSGKSFSVLVGPTDTVAALKQRIFEREGIPPQKQNLLVMGKLLQPDNRLLAEYTLKAGDTVYVTAGVRGQPPAEQPPRPPAAAAASAAPAAAPAASAAPAAAPAPSSAQIRAEARAAAAMAATAAVPPPPSAFSHVVRSAYALPANLLWPVLVVTDSPVQSSSSALGGANAKEVPAPPSSPSSSAPPPASTAEQKINTSMPEVVSSDSSAADMRLTLSNYDYGADGQMPSDTLGQPPEGEEWVRDDITLIGIAGQSVGPSSQPKDAERVALALADNNKRIGAAILPPKTDVGSDKKLIEVEEKLFKQQQQQAQHEQELNALSRQQAQQGQQLDKQEKVVTIAGAQQKEDQFQKDRRDRLMQSNTLTGRAFAQYKSVFRDETLTEFVAARDKFARLDKSKIETIATFVATALQKLPLIGGTLSLLATPFQYAAEKIARHQYKQAAANYSKFFTDIEESTEIFIDRVVIELLDLINQDEKELAKIASANENQLKQFAELGVAALKTKIAMYAMIPLASMKKPKTLADAKGIAQLIFKCEVKTEIEVMHAKVKAFFTGKPAGEEKYYSEAVSLSGPQPTLYDKVIDELKILTQKEGGTFDMKNFQDKYGDVLIPMRKILKHAEYSVRGSADDKRLAHCLQTSEDLDLLLKNIGKKSKIGKPKLYYAFLAMLDKNDIYHPSPAPALAAVATSSAMPATSPSSSAAAAAAAAATATAYTPF